MNSATRRKICLPLLALLFLGDHPRDTCLAGNARAWLTSGAGGVILEKQDDIPLRQGKGRSRTKVIVKTGELRQEMIGFGGSLTESSAHVIDKAPSKDEIMVSLFDPDAGIGISYLRLPMGACDFSLSLYSYRPTPDSAFSIERDMVAMVPLIKQAMSLNPSLKIMASPWSAPGWMKDNNSMLGVEDYAWDQPPASHEGPDAILEDRYLRDYAGYFVNYVQAYAEQGIPIHAVTVQNEPYHTSTRVPTMHMPATQCREFVAILGPRFKEADIATRIVVWDHNYSERGRSGSFYPKVMYEDKVVSAYVAGSAWHAYWGDATVMGELSEAYPDKEVYLTEQTGQSGYYFSDNMIHFLAKTFYPALENGAQTLMAWNLALNEKGGPILETAEWKTAQGLITVNSRTGKWERHAEYAAVGHFSKFVQPGARRIGIETRTEDKLEAAAFVNPDGSVVCVVFNGRFGSNRFDIVIGDHHIPVTLGSFATVTVVIEKTAIP